MVKGREFIFDALLYFSGHIPHLNVTMDMISVVRLHGSLNFPDVKKFFLSIKNLLGK
jgi:hypothetical protein